MVVSGPVLARFCLVSLEENIVAPLRYTENFVREANSNSNRNFFVDSGADPRKHIRTCPVLSLE